MSNLKEKEAKKLLNIAFKYSLKFSKYPEKLSSDGIAETIIFNVCCLLHKVHEPELIETVLIALIQFIAKDKKQPRNIHEVAAHITMRTNDYSEVFKSIISNPVGFDLNPLYCDFFRHPFTDVHYSPAAPKYPEMFRDVVCHIVAGMYGI